MGEDVESRDFSRQDRQRYREKLRTLPRRLRPHAERVEVRLRATDDRPGDRVQPRRRAARTRRCATPRCSTPSPTTTSRPSSASSTSRSTSGRGASPGRRPRRARDRAAGQPQRRRGTCPRGRRAHRHDRHAADPDPRAPDRRLDQRQPALRPDQRADLRGPRRGPAHRHRRPGAAGRPTPTPSPPRRRAPASSSTCRSARRTTRPPGTPRSASPASSSRSGANSPFLFGKELWRETRVALFEQATDTRPQELKAQGVRPRVWFGERWITSIFDQFEENVALLPGAAADLRRRGPGCGARPR